MVQLLIQEGADSKIKDDLYHADAEGNSKLLWADRRSGLPALPKKLAFPRWPGPVLQAISRGGRQIRYAARVPISASARRGAARSA